MAMRHKQETQQMLEQHGQWEEGVWSCGIYLPLILCLCSCKRTWFSSEYN